MARKPAHLDAAGGRTQRERVWDAIRTLREGFTVVDVARRARSEDRYVGGYLRRLERAGFIERTHAVEPAPRRLRAFAWRLRRDTGVDAPHLNADGSECHYGAACQQMWTVLRIAKDVLSAEELAYQASIEARQVDVRHARSYLTHLTRAGYLRALQVSGPRAGAYRYALVRNTGPRAPMVQRVQRVWDPNLNRVMHQEESAHA